MATSGKIQPGDEVEAYNGDGGLVLSVDCYGQDVIVHHTGMYPKVWAAREAAVRALAAEGKWEAYRAFVRLGEWVEDSACCVWERNGTPWSHAYVVAQ